MCCLVCALILTLLIKSVAAAEEPAQQPRTAVFAGGCFWSMEKAFDKAPGVRDVMSGYTGGRTRNPSYENYSQAGHREAIAVSYDPGKITFAGLVEYFVKHINPLDRGGSFIDRGRNYSPAIYVADESERAAAESVIQAIDRLGVYRGRINVPILAREPFWPAEQYHQDYYRKQPAVYAKYAAGSGRGEFIQRHWGDRAGHCELPSAFPDASGSAESQSQRDEQPRELTDNSASDAEARQAPWKDFQKPTSGVLRRQLDRLQYQVTQHDFTEPAFRNRYWNHHAPGLYVDVVSGEPLFASTAKFDSGTGWPAFTNPIERDGVVFHPDYSNGQQRVEVRSKYADSHLGHVFSDGPRARGGMRFCINSAALRFIPLSRLEAEGYEAYAELFRGLK